MLTSEESLSVMDKIERRTCTCICSEDRHNQINRSTCKSSGMYEEMDDVKVTRGLQYSRLTLVFFVVLIWTLVTDNCNAWRMDPMPKSRTLSRGKLHQQNDYKN